MYSEKIYGINLSWQMKTLGQLYSALTFFTPANDLENFSWNNSKIPLSSSFHSSRREANESNCSRGKHTCALCFKLWVQVHYACAFSCINRQEYRYVCLFRMKEPPYYLEISWVLKKFQTTPYHKNEKYNYVPWSNNTNRNKGACNMMNRGQKAFMNYDCSLNKRPPVGSYLQMFLMLILVYAVIRI